jgi:hypothetical protein
MILKKLIILSGTVRFSTVAVMLRVMKMSSKKSKKSTQLDIIKSVRRELPPKGKTFRIKKNEPFRKQKYKGKIDIAAE